MKVIFKWLFGIVVIIAGTANLAINPLTGIIFILTGAFVLPPVLANLETSGKLNISSPVKYLIVVGGILFGVAMSDVTDKPNSKTSEGAIADAPTEPDVKPPLYIVENTKFWDGLKKANIDVRITRRMSRDEIDRAAHGLMDQYSGYDKYFIFYWLPGMKIGEEFAWATSHFNSFDHGLLDIEIPGASDEQERIMKTSGIPKGEIIGKWMDNRVPSETVIIIYRDNAQLKARTVYGDGSFGDETLTLNAKKYSYPNDFGEYYIIEEDGNLGMYSKNGKYGVATRFD